MSNFLAMGGYGFYVWMSYGVTALAIVAELLALRARHRAATRAFVHDRNESPTP
ncbi:MAG: heme exporter protein CcmD [Betaproteobacteria bacterium]